MYIRSLTSAVVFATALAAVPLVVESAAGQQASGAKPFTPPRSTYAPPRTPWGDPDFQGVWSYQSGVPMQRPLELVGKTLTPQEISSWARSHRAISGSGDACGHGTRVDEDCTVEALAALGSYNEFWNERDFLTDDRLSLIVDPPDGRLPPLTPEAQERQRSITAPRGPGRSRYETIRDFSTLERCISTQTPAGAFVYNGGVLWAQSPGWVVMYRERLDTRIIPLDSRPHVDSNIRQWNGNSVGHFEGNTLVVDTTNFTDKQFRGLANGASVAAGIPFGNFHLVERWVPVSATRMHYYATLEDPGTWTKPWTYMIPWEKDFDYQVIEYACQEGNIGIAGSLRGSRLEEARQRAGRTVPVEQTSAALVGLTEADLVAKLGEPQKLEFGGARWTYETVRGAFVLNVFIEAGKVKIVSPNDLPLDQLRRR